jgi:hypothetical protein
MHARSSPMPWPSRAGLKEAQAQLAPALAYWRLQQERNAHGVFFRRAFAYTLYVSALASEDPAQRQADLAQASALLEAMSAEARATVSVRQLSALIASARGT